MPGQDELELRSKQEACALQARLHLDDLLGECANPEIGTYTVGPRRCTKIVGADGNGVKLCQQKYSFVPAP